jgi:hypothetical protein
MHTLNYEDSSAKADETTRSGAKNPGGPGRGTMGVVCRDLLRKCLPEPMRHRVPTLSELEFARRSRDRIRLSVDWICGSHDWTPDDGSSKGHHLLKGAMASYPETTGYIIPTLYDASTFLDRPDLRDRCVAMADWLVSIQLPGGAFQGGAIDLPPVPIVFNTGQIIFGLLRAFAETGSERYLHSARRAGDFLVGCQDGDGAWRRHDYLDLPHVYSVRVAWAMLLLARATGASKYADSGIANMNWALTQQQPNGWFANNHFKPGELPNTHGIAYVTQSLVEGGALTGDVRYTDAAALTADRLLRRFEMTGRIQGVHTSEWKSPKPHTCVTGNVQLGITWLRLHQIRGDVQYLNAALRMVDQVCAIQRVTGPSGIRGGIPGSVPIWGGYAPLQYPNWAMKFWLDLLLLLESVMADDPTGARRVDGADSRLLAPDRYNG